MVAVLALVGLAIKAITLAANMAPQPDKIKTVVRVAAGDNGQAMPDDSPLPSMLKNGDGNIDTIEIFNEQNEPLGKVNGKYIKSNDYEDFAIIHKGNKQQAPFVKLTSLKNDICIPLVTITWPDGSQYGWTGDFGKLCGLKWHYGGRYIDGKNYKPRCVWLGPGTKGEDDHNKAEILTIKMPAFTDTVEHKSQALKQFCGKEAMEAYKRGGSEKNKEVWDDLIPLGYDPTEEKPKSERKRRSYQAPGEDRLIVSKADNHSAVELCESETSWGPDFVSLHEGAFCDMSKHELMPLCTDKVTEGCFHLGDTKVLRRDNTVTTKSYGQILKY